MKRFIFMIIIITALSSALTGFMYSSKAPALKWLNDTEQEITLSSFKGKNVVLLYNGGFCPPCNKEMEEFIPRLEEMDKDKTEFVSVSVTGWVNGSKPTTEFLKEWRKKHSIPFHVVSAKVSELRVLFPQSTLPSTAIINKDGEIAFAKNGASVNTVISEVKKLE